MAANIFGSNGKERYMSADGLPAWWGLGQGNLDNNPDTTEALKFAKMDYVVNTYPFPELTLASGATLGYAEGRIIVREESHGDKAVVLGTASSDFTIVQNMDLARILDPLSKIWHVATAGALNKGETIFIVLDMGNTEVGGDEFKRYMLITNSHIPGKALQAVATNVRVVCQNTLTLALDEGVVRVSLTHSKGVNTKFADFTMMEHAFLVAQEKSLEVIKAMQKRKMSEEAITTAINATLAIPTVPKNVKLMNSVKDLGKFDGDTELGKDWSSQEKAYQRIVENIMQDRDEVQMAFDQQNDAQPKYAYTAYNLYTAITGWADHHKGKAQTENAKIQTMESTLFGERANDKATAAMILAPQFYPKQAKKIATLLQAAKK